MSNVIKAGSRGSGMTGKERLAAALRFRETDRIPWAPKVFIGHYRSGVARAQSHMSIAAFAELLNCDAIGWDCPILTKSRNVQADTERRAAETIQTFTTPVGSLRMVSAYSEESRSEHITEYCLKTAGDYRVAQYIAEHTDYEPDPALHQEVLQSAGNRGVVMSYGNSTPFMDLLQSQAGLPQLYYHLQDFPEVVEELLAAEAERFARFYRAYAGTDAEYVVIHENTSSTLLSPELYRKYCLPLKRRFVEIVRAAGKLPILHMCGRLQALLPLILEAGAAAWESFTPPPNGDTHLKDGRAVAGDGVCLIGGLNAVMLTRWPEAELLAYVERALSELPHARGIILTSGGAMPVECPVEKLAAIGRKLEPILQGKACTAR
jgi:hypothetical protein